MKKKTSGIFLILIALLIGGIIFSISVGSVSVSIPEIMESILYGTGGRSGIVRDIRIPRVIMAVLVGANLSVSGVLLQGVMKNPLADPGITGISSGAGLTVMIVMLYAPNAVGSIPMIGFIGSMVACIMIYALAWNKGISAVRIILAGVAVNAILGGAMNLVTLLNSDNLSGVLTWLNGNLGKKSWNQVEMMLLYTFIGLSLAIPLSKGCNILALGDKNAKSLGYNPNVLRLVISTVAVFLAGISTAYVGIIGFIGLVVPHIARMLVGSEHKILIPFSALFGAFVLLMADTLGRTLISPYEIPVGVIMTVLGGPFFLYLLRKDSKNYGS